jgi:hypothetical protein
VERPPVAFTGRRPAVQPHVVTCVTTTSGSDMRADDKDGATADFDGRAARGPRSSWAVRPRPARRPGRGGRRTAAFSPAGATWRTRGTCTACLRSPPVEPGGSERSERRACGPLQRRRTCRHLRECCAPVRRAGQVRRACRPRAMVRPRAAARGCVRWPDRPPQPHAPTAIARGSRRRPPTLPVPEPRPARAACRGRRRAARQAPGSALAPRPECEARTV